jgi:hypothetical protein
VFHASGAEQWVGEGRPFRNGGINSAALAIRGIPAFVERHGLGMRPEVSPPDIDERALEAVAGSLDPPGAAVLLARKKAKAKERPSLTGTQWRN